MSNLLEAAFSEAGGSVLFRERPESIPGDLRLGWRLGAFVLVLERCRAGTAGLEQVHLLLWALRTREGAETVLRLFDGDRKPDDLVVRYDPALTRTIALAIGAGLASWKTERTISISSAGKALAEAIYATPGVMSDEKDYLAQLPRGITQKAVRELLEV